MGVEHVADVYAKALLGATEKAGQTAAVIEEFDDLMADVLDRFPKFEAVLASALVFAGREIGDDRPGARRPCLADAGQLS